MTRTAPDRSDLDAVGHTYRDPVIPPVRPNRVPTSRRVAETSVRYIAAAVDYDGLQMVTSSVPDWRLLKGVPVQSKPASAQRAASATIESPTVASSAMPIPDQ